MFSVRRLEGYITCQVCCVVINVEIEIVMRNRVESVGDVLTLAIILIILMSMCFLHYIFHPTDANAGAQNWVDLINAMLIKQNETMGDV